MDHFAYRDGELHCQDRPVSEIAAHTGTPVYVYCRQTLTDHYQRLVSAFAAIAPEVRFAVKACSNIHVLRALAELGAGMDVVSGGELHRALVAGVPRARIAFAGVGKTDSEIRAALGGGSGGGGDGPIGVFNIESEAEYEVIASAARSMGVVAQAAVRVNPDVQAGGHEYIATGHRASKFGVSATDAKRMIRRFHNDRAVRLEGIHVHIGSSIVDAEPYKRALAAVLAMIDELAAEGIVVKVLDVGGGFGADYQTGQAPPAEVFAAAMVPMLAPYVARGLKVMIEPGRSISANAGVLLTRVLYVKQNGGKKFVVCDAGMNTLIRPSLYGAFHFVWPTSVAPAYEPPRREERPPVAGLEECEVVGPVCESGDFLAKGRPLPPVARGDLLAVFAAGAYGMSMASRYNSHPLPAEVLVESSRPRVIRLRETEGDLVEHELRAERERRAEGW